MEAMNHGCEQEEREREERLFLAKGGVCVSSLKVGRGCRVFPGREAEDATRGHNW